MLRPTESLRLNTDVATVYTDLDERVSAALSAIDFAERRESLARSLTKDIWSCLHAENPSSKYQPATSRKHWLEKLEDSLIKTNQHMKRIVDMLQASAVSGGNRFRNLFYAVAAFVSAD